MGKPDSTEDFEGAKNTKWSMGKPDSHDYVSMLGENQLVMGKPDSTNSVRLAVVFQNFVWTYC